MEKLTKRQILDVLVLSEVFPSVIWYTNVCNSNGEETVTIQMQKDAALREAEECVKTIFPNSEFQKFATSEKAFTVLFEGRNIGSLHLAKNTEKAPLPEGTTEENTHLQCTIDNSKVEPLVDRVWAEEILANEGVVANA